MNILMLGDIVGKSGRQAIKDNLPRLRAKYDLDCVIANADNAAHGFGLSDRIATDLFEMGVDIISTGDHYTDRDTLKVADKYSNIVRPVNLPKVQEGHGTIIFDTPAGKILFIHVMGRLYMDDPRREPSNPYHAVREIINEHADISVKIVEMHAEATSEKVAMGHYLNGDVSVVAGSHTHIQTSDLKVLSKGTGYITDLGMCGDPDSVLGAKKEAVLSRLLEQDDQVRLEPSEGEGVLNGVIFTLDPSSGTCLKTVLLN